VDIGEEEEAITIERIDDTPAPKEIPAEQPSPERAPVEAPELVPA
jgi:hypothetical protein